MKLCIDNREIERIPKFDAYIKSGKTMFIDGIETDNYLTSDIHTPDNLVGIEYKKYDLVTSIYNGQLDKQLKELKDNFVHPYLFIGYDGIIDMLTQNTGVNPDVLIGKLSSVLARHNVTIMFVGDLLVKFTCDVIEKHYDGKTIVKETEYTPIRKSNLSKKKPTLIQIRHAMLERIPRLGSKKVNDILDNYDIILINKITRIAANEEDLMRIKGIGKKLAKQIIDVLK